jgi:opacity protein-like surface antigen
VRRFWLHCFALSIGLLSVQQAAAQYPHYSYNTGPSSYPLLSDDINSPVSGNYEPFPMVPPPESTGSEASISATAVEPRSHSSTQPPAGWPVSYGPSGTHQRHVGSQPVAPTIGWEDTHGATAAPGGSFFGRESYHAGHFGGVPAAAKPWFFGGGVLIFQRIDDFNRRLSVDDAGDPILYTGDARNRTMAGFEVMGGRYFNGGRNALAVSYWGLFPETQAYSVFDGGGGLNTVIFRPWDGTDPWTGEFQLDQTGTGLGDPTADSDIAGLYNSASGHRVRRNSQFHNVEINLLGFAAGGAARNFNRPVGGSMFCGPGHCNDHSCSHDACRYATGPCCYIPPACGSRLNMSWLAGIRYLQIQDDFEYAALGVPGLGAQTLMYQICSTNHLVGFQVGGRADYCIGSCLNLYGLARSGVYNNSASICTTLGTETASAYESNSPESQYVFSRRTDQVAFLNEIGTGLGWAFSQKWTATVGYRAIVASGVATSVGNLRHQGQSIAHTGINAKDTLVLHGLNIGALYNF